MKRSEQIVHEAYQRNLALLSDLWRAHCIRQIGMAARRCITTVTPLQIDTDIGALGTLAKRRDIVQGDVTTADTKGAIFNRYLPRTARYPVAIMPRLLR